MKKIYQQPRVRIVVINDDDLIATSNDTRISVFRNSTTNKNEAPYDYEYEYDGWGEQW